ncbi:MAG: hypothetical protein H5U40_13050, partial [Polyangiaceae bacterium]|nr:hypothetical protein [Polyangiaceae bacterium]
MSGSKERRGLPVLGPLGELFPSLRNPPEALPPAAVHPRVLIADDGDTRAFVVVVWDDPGGESALHSEVRVRVEGALLAELCRPAAELREAAIRPSSIQALFFTEVAGRVEVALRAFGLRAAELPPTTLAATMAHVRGEAQQSGREVPEVPTSSWQASFALPPGERGQTLLALERAIAERVGDEPWGERPGAFFAALAEATRALGLGAIEPTGDGLDA